MRNRFLCAAAFLAAAVGAGPAVAADLPMRPGGAAPIGTPGAPPYVPDWVGFYVGFEGGGGWDRSNFATSTLAVTGLPVVIPDTSASGGIAGFFFGYNWQWGPVVGGIEGNIDAADIKSSSFGAFDAAGTPAPFDKEFKTDALASVRARLGYLVLPNLLVFGTGGIGFDHARVSFSPNGLDPTAIGDTGYVNEVGWVAGVGLEYKWFEHLLLRVEYLHYDFGQSTAALTLNDTTFFGINNPVNISVDHRIDTVLGGIAYKF